MLFRSGRMTFHVECFVLQGSGFQEIDAALEGGIGHAIGVGSDSGGHIAECEQETAVDDSVEVQGFLGDPDRESGISGLHLQKHCLLKSPQRFDVTFDSFPQYIIHNL